MSGQGQGQEGQRIGLGLYGLDKTKSDPGKEEPQPGRPNPIPSFNPLHVPPVGGRGIGSSDLDPMGRFGPGSILDPRGNRSRGPPLPPFIPSGGIPPGARFDPFGPQTPFPGRNPPRGFGNPDHDHQRPPGSQWF